MKQNLVNVLLSTNMNYILHQVHFKKFFMKEKYNIEINSNVYQESDFPYDPGGTMIC